MDESVEVTIPVTTRIRKKLAEAFFGGGCYILLGTVFAGVFQGLLYLKRGEWPHWILIEVIGGILPDRFIKWLFSPQDWLGLHKIIMSMMFDMPIMVYGIAMGVMSLWVGNALDED